MSNPNIVKRMYAEFFGTFWLVLGGCGSAVFAGQWIGRAGVALAFGLTVLTMAYAIGHISVPGFVKQLWMFWVFPIIGGVGGGLIYQRLGSEDKGK